jgi:hypothetical protein
LEATSGVVVVVNGIGDAGTILKTRGAIFHQIAKSSRNRLPGKGDRGAGKLLFSQTGNALV